MDGLPNGACARGAALIVNTRSRSGERVYFEAIDRLEEMGVRLGATYPVRDPVRLPETVREVLHKGSGYRLLILGGGDGSVSSVVDSWPTATSSSGCCLWARRTTSRGPSGYRRTWRKLVRP